MRRGIKNNIEYNWRFTAKGKVGRTKTRASATQPPHGIKRPGKAEWKWYSAPPQAFFKSLTHATCLEVRFDL